MTKSDIYICFNCGTKNRVPGDRLFAAICGKCKNKLVPTTSGQDQRKTSQPSPKPEITPASKPKETGPWRRIVFLSIIAVGGYFLVTESSNSPPKPSRSVSSIPLPPVVYQTPGIIWNYSGMRGTAPFGITTSPGSDYYLKLVDFVSGDDKIGIFVKGGQKLEVKIPAGSYKLKYASGEAWRGLNSLFGPEPHTSYNQSNSRFDFTQYSGYVVELIKQSGGNMSTRSISGSSF